MWRFFSKILPNLFWGVLFAWTSNQALCAGETTDAFRALHARLFDQKKPQTDRSHPVESYAKQIDWLEHKIDAFGSVVPKTPDIWGQARLTQHREEYEREMKSQLGEFDETLQGSIRRSDQSFLSLAFALNAATGSGTVPTSNAAQSLIVQNNDVTRATTTATGRDPLALFQVNKLSLEPTIVLAQRSRYLNHLNELRRINEGDDTSDSPGYALYLARLPVSILPGKHTDRGYGAEITFTIEPQISEELLPATFRNLVINDLADHLSLVVTKALEHPNLLKQLHAWIEVVDAIDWVYVEELRANRPGQFEQIVPKEIDKMVRAHFPADYYDPSGPDYAQRTKTILGIIDDILEESRRLDATKAYLNEREIVVPSYSKRHPEEEQKQIPIEYSQFVNTAPSGGTLRLNLKAIQEQSFASLSMTRARNRAMPFPPSQNQDVFGEFHILSHLILGIHEQLRNDPVNGHRIHLPDVHAILCDELASAYDFLSLPESLALWSHCGPELANAIRGRKRWLELPPEYYTKNFSVEPNLPPVGYQHREPIRLLGSRFFKHLQHRYVRVKHSATASYAWAIMCEASLLNQALADDMARVAVEKGCACVNAEEYKFYLPHPLPLTTDLSADAVNANERLNAHQKEQAIIAVEDIQRIHAQHVADLKAAAQVFNEYVRCRWPVIVFALDPASDEQNIADSFSRRRELQLAVSVAVADGKVSPSAAGRFVRRLETDIDTIALNRTAVGFSHGNDTFGWRFYPRVQTPPFRGTAHALAETLVGPKPEGDLKSRKLEPGIRECYAVVIMPSFVPYATFSSRSNWFGLANPAKKELNLNDAMLLSRTFQELSRFAEHVQHCGEYRPQDVGHLTRVVDQLSRRMPFSDALVQVPYENTVGGFELFTTGITDLGPELLGFYGAPGVLADKQSFYDNVSIDPAMLTVLQGPPAIVSSVAAAPSTATTSTPVAATTPPAAATTKVIGYPMPGTTLFLVGNHFSVHNTKVIGGGRHIPFRLLSRQIMEVMVPPNVNTFITKRGDGQPEEVVDVHVATPYGVTNHLLIPVVRPQDSKTADLEKRIKQLESSGYAISPETLTFSFEYEHDGSISPAKILPAGVANLAIKYSANPVNAGVLVPKLAVVALLPLKKEGTQVVKDKPAISGAIGFKHPERNSIPVDSNVTLELVRDVVENQDNPPELNRNANGGKKELTMVTDVYIRPDADSRLAKADQSLTIKFVERVTPVVGMLHQVHELPPPLPKP